MDFPLKGPVMRDFEVSIYVGLNKLPNKQSRGRWTEMSWHSFDIIAMEWLSAYHSKITDVDIQNKFSQSRMLSLESRSA